MSRAIRRISRSISAAREALRHSWLYDLEADRTPGNLSIRITRWPRFTRPSSANLELHDTEEQALDESTHEAQRSLGYLE